MEKRKDQPYQVPEVKVRREEFAEVFREDALGQVGRLGQALEDVARAAQRVFGERFVQAAGQPFLYDGEARAFYPDYRRVRPLTVRMHPEGGAATLHGIEGAEAGAITTDAEGNFQSAQIAGIACTLAEPTELLLSFGEGSENPLLTPSGEAIEGLAGYRFVTSHWRFDDTDYRWYDLKGGNGWKEAKEGALILIHRVEALADATQTPTPIAVLKEWLALGLEPQGLSPLEEESYRQLLEALRPLARYLAWEENSLTLDQEGLKEDILAGRFPEKVFGYDFDISGQLEELLKGTRPYEGPIGRLKQQFLDCDKRRANLVSYPAGQIDDINKGHWELCEEPEAGTAIAVHLPEDALWTARPPQLDIIENGVCAIDFGTKSTVVACRTDSEHLLRIGTGNLKKEATLADYENPTVIELRDLRGFREAYAARAGRPFTTWEQVTVSHQAESAFQQQDKGSEIYYSVLSELKQWANEKGRRLYLRDEKGYIENLRSFRELSEGDFDPIELYAYYLGLYINNMRNKIFLDYILSFPVNYAKEVRERLLKSFERGLRKSLPPALLADEEAMQRFRVYAGASEPAAYAMAALKAFGLEPQEEGELTAYGVFDFGGGTTDFDFGIEKIATNQRRYNYTLEQFGKGGDAHLGGENLLDVLAYEVFKANISQMRAHQLPIVLPPSCQRVAGAETLLMAPADASQIAYMNQSRLAEEMRPLWERQPGYEEKYTKKLPITLFTADEGETENQVTIEVSVDARYLEDIIRARIDGGVKNFFEAWRTAFAMRDDDTASQEPVHIFLAGNSCRSPFVQEFFERHIREMEQEGAHFVLHMPLGVEQPSAGEAPAATPEEQEDQLAALNQEKETLLKLKEELEALLKTQAQEQEHGQASEEAEA